MAAVPLCRTMQNSCRNIKLINEIFNEIKNSSKVSYVVQ